MATSSFYKDFTLDSNKAVDAFEKIISHPVTKVKIDRSLTSPENNRRGETMVRKMLSRA